MLGIELPWANLILRRDEKGRTYHARLSLLALVKDENGRVVRKIALQAPFVRRLDTAVVRQGPAAVAESAVFTIG